MIREAKRLIEKLHKITVLELLDFTHTGAWMRVVFLDPMMAKFYVVRYDSKGLKYYMDVLDTAQDTKSYSELEWREMLDGNDSAEEENG